MPSTLMSLALPALVTSIACGVPNAADDYQELIERWETISDDDRALLSNLPPHLEANPQAIAALRKLDAIETILRRAARKEHCDFGLDFNEGLAMLIPHISVLRNVSQNMETVARWHRLHGDNVAAARVMDAQYGMAFHLEQDRTLISSLVGLSIFRQGEELVDEAVESGTLGPLEAHMLLERLRKQDSKDPFGFITSVEMEKTMFGGWVERQMKEAVQDDGSIQVTEELQDLFSTFEINNQAWMESVLDGNMQGYYDYMDDSITILSMEDRDMATARYEQIEVRLEKGEYGTFAKLLAVSLGRVLEQLHVSREELEERIELLEGIANGTIDPLEHANAAWWYMRAARQAEALSAEQRSEPAGYQAILDELLIATLIEDCQFPGSDDPSYPQPVVASWSSGMKQCMNLLLQDAKRHMDAGDADTAIMQLTLCLELAADLAANTIIVDSILAHDATTRVLAMVEAMQIEKSLEAAQQRQLLEALRGIPARDPFGYVNAAQATRRLLVNHVGPEHPWSDHARFFPSDPDGVLYATAWCEQIVEPREPYAFTWPPDIDWPAIDGVIDGEAVTQASALGVEAREAASVGVQVNLDPRPLTNPAIEQRRHDAAILLKEWKRKLGQ